MTAPPSGEKRRSFQQVCYVCQRDSGRVLTADIVEYATRMRINTTRPLRISQKGTDYLLMLVFFFWHFILSRVVEVLLSVMDAGGEDSTSQTCLLQEQNLQCRFVSFCFWPVSYCEKRSEHPAAASLKERQQTLWRKSVVVNEKKRSTLRYNDNNIAAINTLF